MGFLNGLRQGRDAAIEERKAEVRMWRAACRVHGRRYPGCPLDLIEIHALRVTQVEPPAPPAPTGQTTSGKRRRHA